MDGNKKMIANLSAVKLTTMQSHIWVGSHEMAKKQVFSIIKQQVCVQDGCNRCAVCSAIEQQQYHAALWLYPETRYTLEQFDPLFKKLSFGLDEGEQFFIVIQKADCLSQSCANSLLKVLEEPPPGYYFLLTAERLNDLLPTIRSRCMIHMVAYGEQTVQHQDLFDFLTTTKGYNPVAFAQQLYQSNINEREVMELTDALLSFWMQQYKTGVAKEMPDRCEEAQKMITILKAAHSKLPMPGSSKLFLRDLYLQIKGSY
jgi:DNA polymerase-3 subunit delta'